MTAGRGIIHSEMPVVTQGDLWGFQLWLNLPRKDKMVKPRRVWLHSPPLACSWCGAAACAGRPVRGVCDTGGCMHFTQEMEKGAGKANGLPDPTPNPETCQPKTPKCRLLG